MKKLFSALFSLFMLTAIIVAVYFNQQFVLHQIDKVKGLYYVYKGDKALRVLDTQDAILYYNKALSLYPKHYEAWYNLGNIYVAYEDYSSALNAYSQAFKYNPKMMVARMNYGIVSSEKLGDFDSAIEQYNEIINTQRRLIDIPYVYNNKISSTKNKATAYYNKGVTYRLKALYSTDDWELQRRYMAMAIKAYQQSIDIYPDNYDAQYNLGTAYHTIGDYERAGKCYCKAINLAPMNYEAHYNLAILLRKLGYYQEAYDEIDKASTLITALNENSAIQEYVATVMNEITKNYYQNPEYRKYLLAVVEDEKLKTAKQLKNDNKKSTNKNKQFGESITSSGIKFENGKIVATEELDKAILENFGKCPSYEKYFKSQRD